MRPEHKILLAYLLSCQLSGRETREEDDEFVRLMQVKHAATARAIQITVEAQLRAKRGQCPPPEWEGESQIALSPRGRE
mgnify:CR=1 FL=1